MSTAQISHPIVTGPRHDRKMRPLSNAGMMRTRRSFARVIGGGILLASIGVLADSQGNSQFSKHGASQVTFTASGPGGLRIEGLTQELEVRDQGDTLAVIVPLTNLSTGIALRDRHMKEKYLETDKYPTAELKISRGELKVPPEGGTEESSANGMLKIHGTEKKVPFKYRASEAGGLYTVDGSLQLNMGDYGIATPSFMGATVKPDVDVKASFRLQQAKSAEQRIPGERTAAQ